MSNPPPTSAEVFLDPDTGELLYLDTNAFVSFTGEAGINLAP